MTAPFYPLVIETIAPDDGGGFLVRAPDLPGCYSDGETPHEALLNAQDAISTWIRMAEKHGQAVPQPSLHLSMAG